MPRKWTEAQRKAHSAAIKAYWARRKASELPWWRRVMLALGFRQGA
jgi:hypothetical protein